MTQANTMNFLPEDYVEKRQAARSAVVFIGLLVIVVGGSLGTWVFKQWQANRTFEVLEAKRSAQYVPLLTQRARSAHDRERANAIKAMHRLRVSTASTCLLRM